MSKRKVYAGGLAAAALLALAVAASAVPADLFAPIIREYPSLTGYVDARVLAAATAETVTVPTGCNLMLFSATGAFYVRSGGTAAVPAADVTDGTGSALSPAVRRVTPAATFSIIAPTAGTVVTMECYADGGSIGS